MNEFVVEFDLSVHLLVLMFLSVGLTNLPFLPELFPLLGIILLYNKIQKINNNHLIIIKQYHTSGSAVILSLCGRRHKAAENHSQQQQLPSLLFRLHIRDFSLNFAAVHV